jgi:hypothetical protein
MSTTATKITVVVSGHWLLGTLPLAGGRIQETLNDSRTDFLQLYDVEVHSPAKSECVASLPKVVIPKSKIVFVGTPATQHEAPEKSRNNRVGKAAYKAFALVSGYHIWGELHLATAPGDYRYTLLHELSSFFALTGAIVGFSGKGINVLHMPLLFANKGYVSCFDVGDVTGGSASKLGRQTSPQSEPGDLELEEERLCWQP